MITVARVVAAATVAGAAACLAVCAPAEAMYVEPTVQGSDSGVAVPGVDRHPANHAGRPHATRSASATSGHRRFYVRDTHFYTSPWYRGRHRKMVGFGCTRAPYYSPDPRCRHHRGFHHGLDIAMRCRTPLFAGMNGVVVDPDSAGRLGPAYGRWAFRIRNFKHDVDIVIGHVRRVYVRPGERVHKGDRIALASDAGAPDGCHLHFEVRPSGEGYTSAIRPGEFLKLSRVSR